ncbi:hypothetical protein DYQ86_17000 [Acidobacteria bacterium AB60]|nr:hypothetical protein DYQ86_17000 [Acidobacteria bacterium AB60]
MRTLLERNKTLIPNTDTPGNHVNALNSERILAAWELGLTMESPWRGLAPLLAALPGTELSLLGSLPLARRDAMLLELHSLTFGPTISAFACCPLCSAPLEVALNSDELLLRESCSYEQSWMDANSERHMRAVNTADLAAVRDLPETSERAVTVLLARTMSISQGEIDPDIPSTWRERFEELNGPAEIKCLLTCDTCHGSAETYLDIASFLWREVSTAAKRLLAEVHRLASAYGWSEGAILEMNPARRSAYLELLNA